MDKLKIAVVVPCYKVRDKITEVIKAIPEIADRIYIVDDFCPEKTGEYVRDNVKDARLKIIYHDRNKGVGGAVKSGYNEALKEGYDIILKIDGDGQMDPAIIPQFVEKIANGSFDYVKGNRFYMLNNLSGMPKTRMIGNFAISFMSKLVSGYWELMDPANGYTAISGEALAALPLNKVDDGYFFENDMLFRLGTFRANVSEVSVESIYRNEKSNLSISSVIFTFPFKYSIRFIKRIFYNYFLRDFNPGSVYILMSAVLLLSGFVFGVYKWTMSYMTNIPSTAGTVMIPAIMMIFGMQFLISAINFDLNYKIRHSFRKSKQNVRIEKA